ncbi:GIY-YIG nuclease family protein [Mycobacteriaceae bacterium Msp059]|nr:GIY-YIG nuclease family protein [Mycobacteriaceae bacterium Msp059]
MTDELVGQGEQHDGLGAVQPSREVQAEIIDFLRNDSTRLGQVFQGRERGLSADDIAAELGVATSGFVSNYARTIRSLVDGDLTAAPTLALQAARTFRRFLKDHDWSPEAHRYLERNLAELERRASDETARTVEAEQAKAQTERAESENVPGVYVYALPHYLRYPYEKSGRTLMKVGRSDSDVIQRFMNQTRTTALPEEPILLRIYPTGSQSSAIAEDRFHRLLEAADHHRSVARTAGREWFVTSTRFLDEVAVTLSLEIEVVNEAEITDDD